jgi:ArsR family transcriptional regulator, lead/cadmium/zinc/bismuth-responsive transcriptional repressor
MDRWSNGVSRLSDCDHQPLGSDRLPDRQQLEMAAALFRALGDPERLRLLVRLKERECCVSELVSDGDKFTTVSARLQLLLNAQLVSRRREARHVYYRLADAHVTRLITNALEHVAE